MLARGYILIADRRLPEEAMPHWNDYRGFRIETEASSENVAVRIFALEADGELKPGSEPMNAQTYEPPQGEILSAENLEAAALELARSGIDELLGGASGDASPERPRHEIVDEAKAGKPGRLSVPFIASDRNERLKEMLRVLDSTPLEGLRATILLNPADSAEQPVPENRPGLGGVRGASDVPAGEFHVLLEAADTPLENGSP